MLVSYHGAVNHPQGRSAYLREGGLIASDSPNYEPKETDVICHFNALGYRCEEFDRQVSIKLFVCGCSYTFGMGVQYDKTWPYVLKHMLAGAFGLHMHQINLQNFSQVGASNSYIARTVIQQCDKVSPDLAVVAFTHRDRTEYLAAGKTQNIGRWNIHQAWLPGLRYYGHYNDCFGSMDVLKNMYLVQCVLVNRKIPYLFIWAEIDKFDKPPISDQAALCDFATLIDRSRLCPHSINEHGIKVDVADGHPGPYSHTNFALKVFEALDLSAVHRRNERCLRISHMREQVFRTREDRRFSSYITTSGSNSDAAGAATCDRSKLRILALGSRDCVGVGDHHHEICRNLFCHLGDGYRTPERAVDVHNPVAWNASNDLILRTLLVECERERPDLVFVAFADHTSCEHFAEGGLVELCRQQLHHANREVAKLANAYFQYTTNELSLLNTLKNMLLAQEYLKMREIPYVFGVPPDLRFESSNVLEHPVLKVMTALFDDRKFSRLSRRYHQNIQNRQTDSASDFKVGDRRGLVTELVQRLRARFGKSRDQDPNIYPLW